MIAAMAAAGCGGNEGDAPKARTLCVAASIFPLADVANRIGGGDVEVVTLLPPGTDGHA